MNYMKTTFLMALLTTLFVLVGKMLAGDQGMKYAFMMAIGMNFFAYWFSDKMVLRMHHAKAVSQAEAPELYSMVRTLTTKAQLPMPKVYVMQDPSPNAFATGRNPDHAAVAVTTGLLNLLDRDELSGVIGHELSHVRNRDILISTVAATFAGAISMLANMARFGAMMGGSRDDDRRANPMVMLLSSIFAPMAAMLIQMAISRSREFAADKGGAELCGNPMFLASALSKLERGTSHMPMDARPTTAHMFIVNPLAKLGGLTALFRTHPLTQERIKRLEEMRGQRFAA